MPAQYGLVKTIVPREKKKKEYCKYLGQNSRQQIKPLLLQNAMHALACLSIIIPIKSFVSLTHLMKSCS